MIDLSLCRVCNQNFNVGYTPASALPICIQCASTPGNLEAPDQRRLEEIKSTFGLNSKTDPAAVLASKLLSSLLKAVFIPIIVDIVISGILFLVNYFMGTPFTSGDVLIASVISAGISVGLFLDWLSVINDALVAFNDPHVVSIILWSCFVPFVGLLVTFRTRSRLLKKGNDASATEG